jgi:Na+-transporting methylmalonyl-CoA/oxaloacetate decarboxylase gamma subunit
MKKPALVIGIGFALVFLGVLIYSTLGLSQHSVEVCMEFRGRSACRTASAATRESAQRTATTNACAMLASGMTDSMACSATPPAKITWQDED